MKQVSGGFLMKKDKFLLGKRSGKKKWAPGCWDIVGGHGLEAEDPLETLKREALEEIDINVLHAKLLVSLDIPDESEAKSFIYHIYMITSWKGKAMNVSKEHTKIRWFTRDQLENLELALPVYLQLIDAWLKV